jgi:hypothetical protein
MDDPSNRCSRRNALRRFFNHPTFASLASLALLCALSGWAGCSDKPKPPPPIEWSVDSPYSTTRTIAIGPAVNLAGNHDFDPLVVSDTLFGEMQQVQNLNVLPLNNTLIAMRKLGVHSIDDVQTAQTLAEMLGADGLVIPAITAYDPYKPPTVGMILQMYTPRSKVISADAARPNAPTTSEGVAGVEPVSQVNAVFPGNNQSVLAELRVYAQGRVEYGSALESERYIMDADAYMHFVCHSMVRRLMEVERTRVSDR